MNRFDAVNFDHIRFLDIKWYNNCGIVLVFDSITKEYKCYISGEGVMVGNTEGQDIREVAAHGSGFPREAAAVLFYDFDFEEDLTKTQSMHFI